MNLAGGGFMIAAIKFIIIAATLISIEGVYNLLKFMNSLRHWLLKWPVSKGKIIKMMKQKI